MGVLGEFYAYLDACKTEEIVFLAFNHSRHFKSKIVKKNNLNNDQ